MNKSRRRIFVVGCSRGGTTLVQAIFANHPLVTSFPETNILACMVDDFDYRRFGLRAGRRRVPYFLAMRLLNRLGFNSGAPTGAIGRYLRATGRDDLLRMLPPETYRTSVAVDAFVKILDAMASTPIWVEKTPQNVFCLDLIDRYVPGATVVHVVRDGRDNVASLIDAAAKYEAFGARFGGRNGYKRAVEYWNRSILCSYRCQGKENHFVLRYEDVVASPLEAFAPVARMVGIEVTPEMVRYRTEGIAHTHEQWKFKGDEAVCRQPSKFASALNSSQQAYVLRSLLNADDFFPRRTADLDAVTEMPPERDSSIEYPLQPGRS